MSKLAESDPYEHLFKYLDRYYEVFEHKIGVWDGERDIEGKAIVKEMYSPVVKNISGYGNFIVFNFIEIELHKVYGYPQAVSAEAFRLWIISKGFTDDQFLYSKTYTNNTYSGYASFACGSSIDYEEFEYNEEEELIVTRTNPIIKDSTTKIAAFIEDG